MTTTTPYRELQDLQQQQQQQSGGVVWAPVKDLDALFCGVYHYYREGGFGHLLLRRIVNLVLIAFVISLFLVGNYIQWQKIWACRDIKNCADVAVFDFAQPIGNFWIVFLIAFIVHWLLTAAMTVYRVNAFVDTRRFYRHRLQIGIDRSWSDILQRLRDVQEQGLKLCLLRTMQPRDIMHRVLRGQHFLMFMARTGLLDVWRLPWSSLYDWNLRTFLDTSGVSARALRRRLLCGLVLNLICLPFTLVFRTFLFVFQNAEKYHRRQDMFGARQWTYRSRYLMRKIREPEHTFRRRLRRLGTLVDDYLARQESNGPWDLVREVLVFVCGGLLAMVLLMSLNDSSVLTDVVLWDRSLLWYVVVLTTLLGLCRNSNSKVCTSTHTVESLRKLLPDQYRGYVSRWRILVYSLISTLLIPVKLGVLARRAPELHTWIERHTVTVQGVGRICGLAIDGM